MDICQVAYFVPDARQAAAEMRQQFGCGPFQLVPEIKLKWAHFNGEPIDFLHTSAFGQWGDIMLELVQLDSAPFALFETRGLHHVATMVDSMPEAYREFEQQGYEIPLKAMTETGTEFAFVDARDRLGHLIEIYESNETLLGFYAYIKDAARQSESSQIFIGE